MNAESIDSVYVDESGYTGADLLNADQRVHAVAAVRCTEEAAQEIVDRHFSAVKASELKLNRLVRRPTYRRALVAAMLELTSSQRAVGYVYCKRFALWLHLLKDCVEPVCRRMGAPYYENGWNRSFASLLFATAARFWGAAETEEILRSYQRVARSKEKDDVATYLTALRAIRGRELAEYFAPAMDGDPDVVNSLRHDDGTLDLSESMAIGLVDWFEARSTTPYRIVHDDNKAIANALDTFRAIAAVEEEKDFKISSISSMRFPLKFTEAVLADSRSDVRLQLADLLAGSVRLGAEMILGFKKDDGLPNDLLLQLPKEAFVFNIASLDFAGTRATFAGSEGAELIDFMALEMAKHGVGRAFRKT